MSKISFKKEIANLKKLRSEMLNEMSHLSKGTIKISSRKGVGRYYLMQDGKWNYVKQKNNQMKTVKEICQRNYDSKLLPLLEDRIKTLEKFDSDSSYKEAGKLYDKMQQARRNLVVPHVVSDNRFAQEWQNRRWTVKESGDARFKTDNGEMVRSKSELIIANRLKAKGIPYIYERRTQMLNGLVIFPDFTVLNKRTRREIILEHFGMLDNEKYMEDTVRKIMTYAENGFTLGDDLQVTFETSISPLSVSYLDRIIENFLV